MTTFAKRSFRPQQPLDRWHKAMGQSRPLVLRLLLSSRILSALLLVLLDNNSRVRNAFDHGTGQIAGNIACGYSINGLFSQNYGPTRRQLLQMVSV